MSSRTPTRPSGATRVTGSRPTRSQAPGTAARFAARARAVRRRDRRPLLAGLAVLVVLLGLAALVWWGPVLVVREVAVTSDPAGPSLTAAERAQVLDAARAPTGRPLAQVPTGDVADRVRDVPFVAGVRVRRGWPSTLRLEVTHRTPAAALPTTGGRLELVDGEGTSYATVARAPKGVPVVRVDLARAGAPSLQAALAVLDGLPETMRSQVSAVSAQSPSDVRLRVRGKQVVWGSADRTPRKAEVLTVLLRARATVYDVSSPETPVTR